MSQGIKQHLVSRITNKQTIIRQLITEIDTIQRCIKSRRKLNDYGHYLDLNYKRSTISGYVKASPRNLIEVFKISEILYVKNIKINEVQSRKLRQAINFQ